MPIGNNSKSSGVVELILFPQGISQIDSPRNEEFEEKKILIDTSAIFSQRYYELPIIVDSYTVQIASV